MLFQYFKRKLRKMYRQGHANGYQKAYDEQKQSRENLKRVEFEDKFALGKKVIGIHNEWENMTVGEIIGYDRFGSTDMPIVFDYITGEKKMFNFYKPIKFEHNIFKFLSNLNPEQRQMVFYHNYINLDNENKVDPNAIVGYDEHVQVMKSNGCDWFD